MTTATMPRPGTRPARPGQDRGRGTRHPMPAVLRARDLHAAGWSSAEIARILVREGLTATEPHRRTVDVWCKPRIARKHAEFAAAFARAKAINVRLARIRVLAGANVSALGIAQVMTLDYGMRLTAADVRTILATDAIPDRCMPAGR